MKNDSRKAGKGYVGHGDWCERRPEAAGEFHAVAGATVLSHHVHQHLLARSSRFNPCFRWRSKDRST